MRCPKLLFASLSIFLISYLTGCKISTQITALPAEFPAETAISTDAPVPSYTAIPPSPSLTILITSTPTDTPSPSPTVLPPCSPELCTIPGHFLLARPIGPLFNDILDSSYRYGSTQEGARPTHHGVEFVNPEGTPVLASAQGTVIVAGDDYQEAYAEFPYYYGNLVIIEHDFPVIGVPVFSLYGHLSEVRTHVGERVQVGDEIGKIGYTGVAEWSHLHFEVRIGENRFTHTRNPELWLKPHLNIDGMLNGGLAGRIIDEYGDPIYIPNIFIERLDEDGESIGSFYVESYKDSTVNGDNELSENFAVGDLPTGKYRVTFIARGLQTIDVLVYSGQLSIFVFDANDM